MACCMEPRGNMEHGLRIGFKQDGLRACGRRASLPTGRIGRYDLVRQESRRGPQYLTPAFTMGYVTAV
jgi:hypothetical protein